MGVPAAMDAYRYAPSRMRGAWLLDCVRNSPDAWCVKQSCTRREPSDAMRFLDGMRACRFQTVRRAWTVITDMVRWKWGLPVRSRLTQDWEQLKSVTRVDCSDPSRASPASTLSTLASDVLAVDVHPTIQGHRVQ